MDGFAPIDSGKRLLADAVFQHLSRAIIEGQLDPGERIRDAELAEQLQVSRMPVREALQRLERIGLVEMMPSRYTRVTEVTEEVIRHSMAYAAYKLGNDIHIAATRLTDDERTRALELLDGMADALGDTETSIAARIAFSRYIASTLPQSVYSQHLDDLDVALERNLNHIGPVLGDDELRENYAELREALVSRDAGAAERLVRAQFGR
ncbi:GntR family transcriptional regulator [Microbacterium sp. MEC084]|uniref:GntR family transcriptional regulator n=1 Tax=Microbacterium sp. MEC084 TaxID=1963027 RepID=UPI00106F94AE|nr:GntR family transcriptional regulator [Microbacterium sp. MEC084]MCD1268390.1 GntR family transcriptional regulator [Microbacterium sp. MEC084]